MADSPKFSLLDLQKPDVSQYGKKNLELPKESTRSTDSSYRKQLTESLAKKQQRTSHENQPSSNSRPAADLKTDRGRTERQEAQPQTTATEARETQKPAETSQRDARPADSGSEKAEIEQTPVEVPEPINGTGSESVPVEENKPDTSELAKEIVPVQTEVPAPVPQKEQRYSLFDTSTSNQPEGKLEQEVTTGDTKIRPPANFQFSDNQNLVNVQTEVTETKPAQSIPIPEGLAELLKKQEITTTQTDTGSQNEIGNAAEGDSQIQAVAQSDEAINTLSQEQNTEDDAQLLLNSGKLQQIQMTDELKQAIQQFQEQQAHSGKADADQARADLQTAIQQRYLGNQQQKSDSNADDQKPKESTDSQQANQQVSQTVIEQVQQKTDSLKPDQTEFVDKKTDTHPKTDEKPLDQSGLNPVHSQLKPVTNALQRVLTEVTKANPLPQEHHAASSNAPDQTTTQPNGVSQVAPAAVDAQAATPVGPAVDVKQVDQLVERIATAVRQSHATGQQLKIRLSPPELGTLQIEVSLKNGEYTAKLEVQNRHAQKVINDNIAQLKDALAKTGVSMDRIDVHINTHSSEDQRSSQSDSQPQSGTDFSSDQFSDQSGDAEQGHEDRGYVEETVQRDDVEPEQQNRPQVIRSQGVATENVEEIDVQI